MADVKITDLPASSGVSATDVLVVDTGAATQKVTKAILFTAPGVTTSIIMIGDRIYRSVDTHLLYLSGGNGAYVGGRIALYGHSHSTSPDLIQYVGEHYFYDKDDNPDRGIHVEAWTAITSFGSGWAGTAVAYMKDPMGFIHWRGKLVKSDVSYTPAFSAVAAAYRPPATIDFIGTDGSSAVISVQLTTGGEIITGVAGTIYLGILAPYTT